MDTELLVKTAFKKYKQYVYYEQLDLFQREKLADFECSNLGDKKYQKTINIVKKLQNGEIPTEIEHLITSSIKYHLIPKSIKTVPDNEEKHFLSNDKSSNEYLLEGVNYFIDVPLELHLLDVIWTMKVGNLLDSKLCESCFGNRLNERMKRPDDQSTHLYKFYNEQSSAWRNQAIEKAEHVLKVDKKNIAIISLDLKQCFYFINIHFEDLVEVIKTEISDEYERTFAIQLTMVLKNIHDKYRQKISEHFSCTHPEIAKIKNHNILPIGLVSSGVLCNWYLKDFDAQISEKLNPIYYGRYVDDLLIVIGNPKMSEGKEKVHNFILRYFCANHIFKDKKIKDGYLYHLFQDSNLRIQEEKIILHYYSTDHSYALLDVFKKMVDENASAFYLLPENDLDYYINKTSYNLLFDGSINKFRNLTGIKENVTELSKNLSNIIMGLSQSKKQKNFKAVSDQIIKFYKGKNFINFCRTWEKMFTFTLVTNLHGEGANFYNDIQDTILRIEKISPEITKLYPSNGNKGCEKLLERVKKDLQEYLDLSLSLSLGLLGSDIELYTSQHEEQSIKRYKKKDQISKEIERITHLAHYFRISNLIRHNYIAFPLINYTNYQNSLIDWDKIEKFFAGSANELMQEKVLTTPRFIHFDEYYLFCFLRGILSDDKKSMTEFKLKQDLNEDYLTKISYYLPRDQFPVSMDNREAIFTKNGKERKIHVFDYYIPKKISVQEREYDPIKIGVANIKVKEANIKASYLPSGKANLSFDRLKDLYKILNLAKEEKCDLLVLPELSVPYRWLPFMVKYSRIHQVGLIFGMEYWISKAPETVAYNFITTALPIRNKDDYKTCCLTIRCKNHYSPFEKKELQRSHHAIPDEPTKYDLFRWRGCQFSAYNCYELADIEDRSIFKSELDFLVACVLNKDINYFSSIVESVVKDLHCFVVQVNCSEYGDSRIVQPTNHERMDLIRVSGGENNTILTSKLNIKKLRDFQCLDYSETDKEFKPTPPGFDCDKVKARGRCPKD
jgi:hypothetical protein